MIKAISDHFSPPPVLYSCMSYLRLLSGFLHTFWLVSLLLPPPTLSIHTVARVILLKFRLNHAIPLLLALWWPPILLKWCQWPSLSSPVISLPFPLLLSPSLIALQLHCCLACPWACQRCSHLKAFERLLPLPEMLSPMYVHMAYSLTSFKSLLQCLLFHEIRPDHPI